MSGRGFLYFAFNNDKINYMEMALASALSLQYHSEVKKISIVTDKKSWASLSPKHLEIAQRVFDKIIYEEVNWAMDSKNIRRYRDTEYHSERAKWHNTLRYKAYELSPYEETILLDTDYIVQSKNLDLLWGSDQDFRINRKVRFLDQKESYIERLNSFSIPLYWATVVYFRKGEMADLIFQLIAHLQKNYFYYRMLYGFKDRIYRNDNTFSIALHTLSGFLENEEFNALPFEYLTSSDRDELHLVENGATKFLIGKHGSHNFTLLNVKGVDVHCMNKFAFCRKIEDFIEVYS
jgi:hypothetical protein